jgi:NAD(P)-dependent dehydrogenase (short-subunit alcohol dehydrogenase family)
MLAPGVSIDAALEATRVVGTAVVSRLEFVLPLRPVPDSLTMHARAEARPESGGRFGFRLATRVGDGPWTAHLTATLAPTEEGDQLSDLDLDAVSRRCAEALTAADAYARLASCGWQIGGALRALGGVRVSADEALARFEFRRPHAEGRVQLDPRIGQACMDLVMLVAGAGEASLTRGLHLPLRVGRLRRHAAPTTSGWILVRRRMRGEEPILDAWVLDDGRGLIVSLIGIELTFLPADAREFLSRGLDDWLFELGWEALPASPSARTEPGAWVVLADRSGIGDELLRKLAAQGDLVVAVGRNQANPRDAIAGALESAGGRCRGVVHLWSLDLPGVDGVEPGELERSLLANNLGVLHAVRALARIESPHPPLLWIITRGAQAVQNPVGAQAPPQATVWGLGRVIAEEHPECWGGLVDLDPCVDAGTAANTLVERLQSNDGERQVACRSNVFFGARFAPLSRRADALSSIPLRPDATYLVTGGFGGVGLATARWMVTEGARRLVLIGRTPLPPRAQWKTADESTEIGRRIAAVRELEALGASVHLAALDIGDGEAVEGFWNAYHQEGWPPIRGVVHAAVVIEDGLLRDLDPESFATVARPKVCGGLALHRLANQVDFFTLFSSLGSMLGQAGQATYAAANAFLDALAHYRTGRGLPAISINWGGWREAGLGTASAGARLTIRNLESEGIASFTTAQGLQVFGRLLADNLPQAIVMPVSWSRFRSSHQAAHDSRLFAAVLQEFAATRTTSSPDQASFRSRLLETEPAARLNVLERFLTDQLAAVLRLPVSRVDPDRPMGSMGLESLLALELRNRLESRLGLRLSATIVWNYPTISGLAGYLAGLMDVTLDASGDVTPPVERGSEPVLPDASELDTMSELEALRALGAAREKA